MGSWFTDCLREQVDDAKTILRISDTDPVGIAVIEELPPVLESREEGRVVVGETELCDRLKVFERWDHESVSLPVRGSEVVTFDEKHPVGDSVQFQEWFRNSALLCDNNCGRIGLWIDEPNAREPVNSLLQSRHFRFDLPWQRGEVPVCRNLR